MEGMTSLHVRHPFEDFRNFAWYVWKELGLPSPTPIQYDICEFLKTGPRRRVIMAYRGVGKSWVTAAYVCWLLWKDPSTRSWWSRHRRNAPMRSRCSSSA